MVIMPALFVFGLTAEMNLNHRMTKMADQTVHNQKVAEWAERKVHTLPAGDSDRSTEQQLTDLYKQSVANSGVRIVPGDSLSLHHRIANYGQENPFKILAGIGGKQSS